MWVTAEARRAEFPHIRIGDSEMRMSRITASHQGATRGCSTTLPAFIRDMPYRPASVSSSASCTAYSRRSSSDSCIAARRE
jgi:hypothetical protein